MAKRDAFLALRDQLVNLASLCDQAARGDEVAISAIRSACTNRQYVGPQLELGREELNLALDDSCNEEERTESYIISRAYLNRGGWF